MKKQNALMTATMGLSCWFLAACGVGPISDAPQNSAAQYVQGLGLVLKKDAPFAKLRDQLTLTAQPTLVPVQQGPFQMKPENGLAPEQTVPESLEVPLRLNQEYAAPMQNDIQIPGTAALRRCEPKREGIMTSYRTQDWICGEPMEKNPAESASLQIFWEIQDNHAKKQARLFLFANQRNIEILGIGENPNIADHASNEEFSVLYLKPSEAGTYTQTFFLKHEETLFRLDIHYNIYNIR